MLNRLQKGYERDAGIDVVMDRAICFAPHSVSTINLGISVVPKKNTAIIVCPRSGFANKGIMIATCPVDPDYNGDIHAIVFNGSDDYITCEVGTAFCQLVSIKTAPIKGVRIKKPGRRSNGKFGSTDK